MPIGKRVGLAVVAAVAVVVLGSVPVAWSQTGYRLCALRDGLLRVALLHKV